MGKGATCRNSYSRELLSRAKSANRCCWRWDGLGFEDNESRPTTFLRSALITLLLAQLFWFQPRMAAASRWSAASVPGLVGVQLRAATGSFDNYQPTYRVAKDGTGDFTTIQAAINMARPAVFPSQGTIIKVKRGFYFETVIVPATKRYMTIIGDGDDTIVACDRYNGMINSNGDPLSTLNSGCFVVLGDDFTAINMQFLNTSPRPPPNTYIYQAVALRVSANRTVFFNCSMYSYQDTLYAHVGNQYYRSCRIFGSVDFVFGYAKAVFDDCTLTMSSVGYSAVTAQYKRDLEEDNCYVIINSQIIGTPPPNGQGWIGRAWGQCSCTIIANSFMDEVVSPDGWNNFMTKSREITSFYAEYNNTGVGANLDGRVEWMKVMTSDQRNLYLSVNYIGLGSWVRSFDVLPPLPPSPPPLPPSPPRPPPPTLPCSFPTVTSSSSKKKKCQDCCKKRFLGDPDCVDECLAL